MHGSTADPHVRSSLAAAAELAGHLADACDGLAEGAGGEAARDLRSCAGRLRAMRADFGKRAALPGGQVVALGLLRASLEGLRHPLAGVSRQLVLGEARLAGRREGEAPARRRRVRPLRERAHLREVLARG